MPSKILLVSVLVIFGALMSVYVVFRNLDASRINDISIGLAMAQTKNIRCNIAWGDLGIKGKGVVLIGENTAKAEYIFTHDSSNTTFTSLFNRETGDLHLWQRGSLDVIHFANAPARTDLLEQWWKTGLLSNCVPQWYGTEAALVLPAGSRITDR